MTREKLQKLRKLTDLQASLTRQDEIRVQAARQHVEALHTKMKQLEAQRKEAACEETDAQEALIALQYLNVITAKISALHSDLQSATQELERCKDGLRLSFGRKVALQKLLEPKSYRS